MFAMAGTLGRDRGFLWRRDKFGGVDSGAVRSRIWPCWDFGWRASGGLLQHHPPALVLAPAQRLSAPNDGDVRRTW